MVPFVLVLVIAGCLLASVHVQSLIVMVVLGALGTAMKRLGWPRPPFAIGFVLGSITEKFVSSGVVHLGRARSC